MGAFCWEAANLYNVKIHHNTDKHLQFNDLFRSLNVKNGIQDDLLIMFMIIPLEQIDLVVWMLLMNTTILAVYIM